jgi:hypothetical protein
MGRGLIAVVKAEMGSEWSPMLEQSWCEVFGAISYDMIRAQNAGRSLSPIRPKKQPVRAVSLHSEGKSLSVTPKT